jgi:O-methyltransferase domain
VAGRPPPALAVRGVLGLRRRLMSLADRLVPAQAALFDLSVGMARTQIAGTLAELRVADELAKGPATAEELAVRLGVSADALHRLMRAAALTDVLDLDRRGRFSLGRTGQALRSDHPNSVRDWAQYFASASNAEAWADLTETVRTGESAFPRVHGRSVWQWFAEHPDEERTFAGGMRAGTTQDAPFIVGGYDWPAEGVLCDVAGGVGTLLAAVLESRPGLRGVLVDAPGVLAEADGWLASRGLRGRVELSEGDIFRSLATTADVYMLKNILHDWDDAACATILGALRAAMPAGSRVVIVEYLQERNRPDTIASLSDIQMMNVCDDGRERSAEEIQALLRGAGLRPGKVVRTGGPGLVEAFA